MKAAFKAGLFCAVLLFPASSFAGGESHKHAYVPGFLNGPNHFRFIEAGVATRGVAAGPATSALIPVIGPPGVVKVSAPSLPPPGAGGKPGAPEFPGQPVTQPGGTVSGAPSLPNNVEGLVIGEIRELAVPASKQPQRSGKRFVPYCD